MSKIKYENIEKIIDKALKRGIGGYFSPKKVRPTTPGVDVEIFIQTVDGTSAISMTKNELLEISKVIRRNSNKKRFVCQAKILSKDDFTVEECCIGKDSVLNVAETLNLMEVTVEYMDRRKIILEMSKNNLVRDLEARIMEELRFHREEHWLEYNGSILHYDMRLEDCLITDRSVIKVVERLKDGMLVHGVLSEGMKVTFEVGRGALVSDVMRVMGIFGVSPRIHVLSHKRDILAEGWKTVRECHIVENSVIHVLPRVRGGMIVFVATIEGDCAPFCVSRSLTVADMKKKIQEKIGISQEGQRLIFQGRSLSDECKLDDENVGEGSVIEVGWATTRLFVSIAGKILSLGVRQRDRIIDVKRKIEAAEGIKTADQILQYNGESLVDHVTVAESQLVRDSQIVCICNLRAGVKILVRLLDGEVIDLNLGLNDRIIDIKKKVTEKSGLAPEEYKLLNGSDILDDDYKTIWEYKIDHLITLDVVPRPREIFAITEDGRAIQLEISKNDRIIDLKKKIQERLGLTPDEHKLVYQGIILEDDKLVDEYQIAEKSVINVVPRQRGGIQIFAKTGDGKMIEFQISMNDRIIDIKMKIQEKIGLTPEEQTLIYRGKILEDDKLANEYQIAEKSVIDILTKERDDLSISVKKTDGSTFWMNVSKNENLIFMKNQIWENIGYSPDEQILSYGGNILRDDSIRLINYGVTDRGVFEVSLKVKLEVQILTTNMESVPLTILASDRMIDVKKKIEENTGIPVSEQILYHREEIISDDEDIVVERHICDKDDIVVTIIMGDRQECAQGICLVINNEIFEKSSPRRGTQLDEQRIRKTFEEMGYTVMIRSNVNSGGVGEVIEDTKASIERDHRNLVVFVLSHGDEKGILTVDEKVLPFEEFCQPFNNDIFPELLGKSRLFFFVCNQGSNVNKGVRAIRTPEVETDGIVSTYRENYPEREYYPATSDVFIGYATAKSFRAFRYLNEGTLYVKHLCNVIEKYPLWSVADIHQEVQTLVSQEDPTNEHLFQMPYYTNMLTKRAYFIEP